MTNADRRRLLLDAMHGGDINKRFRLILAILELSSGTVIDGSQLADRLVPPHAEIKDEELAMLEQALDFYETPDEVWNYMRVVLIII
ncbi:hypothetical protein CXK92_13395 [Stutzerimonas stutzeri]|uniref:Uncharacterized protein n=1 Tax=Stutzerimonas stutzeri TaxID=316 RepID=A0A2N8RZ22_STUST|nr:hypothetical protein CXK92_13395 [Stutzerimonas stutzeri]